MDAARIALLILDVDGVLTDGRLMMASAGEPAKAFHAQDGCALKLWLKSGGKVAILSARASESVARRAAELGIGHVRTGEQDKLAAYRETLLSLECADEVVAYVGDDLPDLGPMQRCGLPIAVANAVPAVKQASLYVTRRRGGEGAVAEVVELLLRKQGRWSSLLAGQV